jgi:inorganic pyrophosphatase
MDLAAIPHGLTRRGVTVRAVVESPRGGLYKFTYDPELEAFTLSKRLPAGLVFPLDFGFVPSTRAEDGDPLDILILADAPLITGCVLQVRLLGVVEAEQTEEGETFRNDRLIAAAVESALHRRVRTLADLGDGFLAEFTAFWTTYNRERGKDFRVLAVRGAAAAAGHIRTHGTP